MEDNAPRVAGPSQCKWCSAVPFCAEARNLMKPSNKIIIMNPKQPRIFVSLLIFKDHYHRASARRKRVMETMVAQLESHGITWNGKFGEALTLDGEEFSQQNANNTPSPSIQSD